MNSTTKLFGAVVFAAAFTAGCNGANLPTGTGTTGEPGFTGRITLNNQPAANREVFLKQFNGGTAGTFNGTTKHVDDSTYFAMTDSNGAFFLKVPSDAVAAGGLYGLGYDASLKDSTQTTADKNPNEILWFTTPAFDLSKEVGNTATVNFDLGWAASAFSPKNGDSITPTNDSINFNLPTYQGATQYEVDIYQGSAAGANGQAPGSPVKGSTPQLTWSQVPTGNSTYNYEAKVMTSAGMAGVTTGQAASPFVVFSVTGAQ